MTFDPVGVVVMMSGPGDTSDEVATVQRVIIEWNTQHSVVENVVFVPKHFSTNTVPVYRRGTDGQAVINEQLTEGSDVVFCLFKHRLGTPTPRNSHSGTVEEAEIKESKAPVHIYFWNGVAPLEVLSQPEARAEYDRLDEFRKEFHKNNSGLYASYGSLDILAGHIEKALWADARKLKRPAGVQTSIASTVPAQPQPAPVVPDAELLMGWLYSPQDRASVKKLVDGHVRKLVSAVNALEMDNRVDAEALLARYQEIFDVSMPVLELFRVGVENDPEIAANLVWKNAMRELLRIRTSTDRPTRFHPLPADALNKARHMPAMLALRVVGLAAVQFDSTDPKLPRTQLWMDLCELTWRDPDANRRGQDPRPRSALDLLDEHQVLDPQTVAGASGQKFSMSRYMRALLRPTFPELVDAEWDRINDQFEYRRALLYARNGIQIAPMLASTEWTTSGLRAEVEFKEDSGYDKPESPWGRTDYSGKRFVNEETFMAVSASSMRDM